MIVLGDVQVDATLELVRTQLDTELARNARLSAERVLADRWNTRISSRNGDQTHG